MPETAAEIGSRSPRVYSEIARRNVCARPGQIDRRTRVGRALARLEQRLAKPFGGHLTNTQRAAIRRVAMARLLADKAAADALVGHPVPLDDVVRLARLARHAERDLEAMRTVRAEPLDDGLAALFNGDG